MPAEPVSSWPFKPTSTPDDPGLSAASLASTLAGACRGDQVQPVAITVSPAGTALWYRDPLAGECAQRRVEDFRDGCRTLRYLAWGESERAVAILALELERLLGRDLLARCRFEAIPRGGHIVLGMLLYALRLPTAPPDGGDDGPLVIVDDCALTGARFAVALAGTDAADIVFAHICSHPDLRVAIRREEPRVRGFAVAFDLADHAPARCGPNHADWVRTWRSRLPGRRYWIGTPDHVCFPWNEPDRILWNPSTGAVEKAWPIVPPEFCLKNHATGPPPPVPVQVHGAGIGPVRTAASAFVAEIDGRIHVAARGRGEVCGLDEVGSAMWRALHLRGTVEAATEEVAAAFDAPAATVAADLLALLAQLSKLGVIESDDAD